MSKKITAEDFIRRAREVHGDKYDYSKVEYHRTTDKVIIICPIHGEFNQVWHYHLRGNGCQKCSNERNPNIKLTNEEFINRARKTHKGKYTYEKVIYIKSSLKVIITCPDHGDFLQKPSEHLEGHGCNKCKSDDARKRNEEKRKSQYLSYIDASLYCVEKNIKSGNQYYKFYRKHKPKFLPAEPSKLYNQWINWQEFLKTKNRNTHTYDYSSEFIKQSEKIHNNKYDYTKTKYISSHQKVIIICPEHGEFFQLPNSHLNGQGCPKCIGHGFEWMSFEEAKKIVQSHNIKTSDEYKKWWVGNKKYCQKIGLPQFPYRTYKNKEKNP